MKGCQNLMKLFPVNIINTRFVPHFTIHFLIVMFQVSKLLGKGGFGAVYHITRSSDQAAFAMKCETYDVKKQVLSMDCKVLRGTFLIRSPHFCSVLDRGKVPDRFRFLVMKLVSYFLNSNFHMIHIGCDSNVLGWKKFMGTSNLSTINEIHPEHFPQSRGTMSDVDGRFTPSWIPSSRYQTRLDFCDLTFRWFRPSMNDSSIFWMIGSILRLLIAFKDRWSESYIVSEMLYF